MASKTKPQIGYKAVNFSNGKLVSFFKPSIQYHLHKQTKEVVKPDHNGGLYLYHTIRDVIIYTKESHKDFAVIIKCKYHKPIIDKGEFSGKFCASVIIPTEIMGLFINGEYIQQPYNSEWLFAHLAKYPKGTLPPQSAVIIYNNQTFNITDCGAVKRGRCRELMKALKVEGIKE